MTGAPEPPLAGVRVLEFAGIGPVSYAGMLLADQGATVLRIDRPGDLPAYQPDPRRDLLGRGKRSITIDLKAPGARERTLGLVEQSDILLEGFRPGVMERLGVGPEACLATNPRLVYGRATGWGQSGPRRDDVGHDLNYLSITGLLHAIGSADGPPVLPLNVVGDYGGGGMFAAFQLLAAFTAARATGKGRVVDAAIVDGVVHMMSGIRTALAQEQWRDRRAANLLDGGAPFYAVYETADARHLAVAAIEPKFYRTFLAVAGLDLDPATQFDETHWPTARATIAARLTDHPRDEWVRRFAGTESCVTPVLDLTEAGHDEHLAARGLLDAGPPAPAIGQDDGRIDERNAYNLSPKAELT